MACAASAQTLTKEIVIEREIDPTLPETSRINNFPALVTPKVAMQRLAFSDQVSAVQVPEMISTLEPANGQPSVTLSPYRGYASVGYFPAYNLGVNAGYSIIAKPATSLNVWTQFDGNSYKDQYDETLKRNTVTAGADFSHLFGRTRRLDVSADFTYNAYNRPWEAADDGHHTMSYNIDAAWSARSNAMAYYATAEFGHFGFSGKETGISYPAADAVSQNIMKVGAGTAYFLTDKSSLAGHVDVNFQHFNHFNILAPVDDAVNGLYPMLPVAKGKTLGLITLAPAYRYSSGVFSTNIGVKLQIATNSGKTFHVAPDVNFNLRPAPVFAVTLRLSGGQHVNSLANLYNIDPYMNIGQAYKFSSVPFAADLNVAFGPFYGASLELFGGYAVADDWLMPDVAVMHLDVKPREDAPVCGSMFTPVDLRALHYGAKFTWKYNKNIEASVKYSGAPGSYRHSYYLHADRAKHVLEVAAAVRPIEKLTVDASFNLRAGRSLFTKWGTLPEADAERINLRNSNSLNIGASYQIFDYLTVFAKAENVLGRQAYLYNLLEQQGVHGLVGAALKF